MTFFLNKSLKKRFMTDIMLVGRVCFIRKPMIC